ncbi:hypothetical protein [Tepidibacter hydrothermalis]|uniref:Uncharacterized protein n=1 Tax=Tepidibacter hydrothermalis TaxID=3036126 RepID=A0ABY8EK43_9FIRM|nr:hypothetical protein [Tepidibacter hydrothermalis]WFD12289.1 hypothetical protein P4S50_09430 [Tepidibacter hydrothermalis]
MNIEEFLNLKVDIKKGQSFVHRNCYLYDLIENSIMDPVNSNINNSVFSNIFIREAVHTFSEYREDDYPEEDIFTKYGVVIEDRYDLILSICYLDGKYKYISILNQLDELNESEAITMLNYYLEETYNEYHTVLVID